MKDIEQDQTEVVETTPTDGQQTDGQQAGGREGDGEQHDCSSKAMTFSGEGWQWWVKLVVQPMLVLVAGAALFAGLGLAQRLGWISSGSTASPSGSAGNADQRYICPMMCTPPQSEPGRCPVCAMELVPATTQSNPGDTDAIQIDPVARRVANIRTVSVKPVVFSRSIRAVGELNYDESTLKTISAYVDGRIDRLFADSTGVVVTKGDHLALVYAPELFSGQSELLTAKRARVGNSSSPLFSGTQIDLYESAKQKLLDLGMTAVQIEQIERKNKADSRMYLCAPISGTVIDKRVVEGEYVKQGDVICKLADLSNLWLVVNLFPEDAALVRYGHRVRATVDSLPGRSFEGRVVFVEPEVDPKTRTVGVRVVMPNPQGILRVGDFATAKISVGCQPADSPHRPIYDAELAKKWISPRHPHVVESSPGACRVCGIDLVPASNFGFANEPTDDLELLVVPRQAVLMAGENSVVYVETKAGRFEIREVTLGPSNDDQIVILRGVQAGEKVAVSGNFLIDSQMQLSGKPSLIDPQKIERQPSQPQYAEVLAELPAPDRILAEKQHRCPVADMPLGSMGVPLKVDLEGTPVFICCEGCRKRLLGDPKKYLSKLAEGTPELPKHDDQHEMDVPPIGVPMLVEPGSEPPQTKNSSEKSLQQNRIAVALAELPPAQQSSAAKQKHCPVTDLPLGSMGVPIPVALDRRQVFLCCEACRTALLANPTKYLDALDGGAAQ